MRGATALPTVMRSREEVFQSTHPVRGATEVRRFAEDIADISIHAPREGCDLCPGIALVAFLSLFQSTHPVRGATMVILPALIQRTYFNPRTP